MARRRMNIVGSRFHRWLLLLNVLRQCFSPLWDTDVCVLSLPGQLGSGVDHQRANRSIAITSFVTLSGTGLFSEFHKKKHVIPESVVLLSRTQNMLCFRPNNFHKCLTQFQLGCRVRFSMVLQLFGMMESMIAVLPLGLLKMQAFQWWSFCKVVFKDASLRGWGALFGGVVVRGAWSSAQNQLHNNHFETLAAFLAMKLFCHVLTSQRVLVRMDNTTVVSYINKQEVHYPLWNFLALCCHGAERIRCLLEPSMFPATWMNAIEIVIRIINVNCPEVKFRYTPVRSKQ